MATINIEHGQHAYQVPQHTSLIAESQVMLTLCLFAGSAAETVSEQQ